MGRRVFLVALLTAVFGISTAMCQTNATMAKTPKGVPEQYAGRWVCQSVGPGYNLRPPNADLSQPMTDKMTTPGTVAVIKFSLKADGTYEAPNAKGHYSFDPAKKTITWLDGLHQKTFTKTEIGNRPNGAPSMHFLMLERYWGCFKSDSSSSSQPATTTATKSQVAKMSSVPERDAIPVLANPEAPAYAAPIVSEGVAQLVRQSATSRIRGIPSLAHVAQLTISRSGRRPRQNVLEKPSSSEINTRFLRSNSWFKPWGWASEISKRIPWDDPTAPAGSGFARQQAGREMLTKLFSACLDYYEQRANAEGYRTDDLAVTYSHSIALITEVSTGRKLTAREELALRETLRAKIAYYPYNFDDVSKQSIHETLVITTILTQAGYADATLNRDQQALAAFRETARRNVDALKAATIDDLVHAGWGPGSD